MFFVCVPDRQMPVGGESTILQYLPDTFSLSLNGSTKHVPLLS